MGTATSRTPATQTTHAPREPVASSFDDLLAHHSAILFSDPFSELTRSRQKVLLVVAALTIVLSLAILQVTQVSVADAQLRVQLPRALLAVAGAVSAYLLVVYAMGAHQDYRVYRYSIRPSVLWIQAQNDQQTVASRLVVEKLNSRLTQTGDTVGARIDLFEERRRISEELDAKIDEVGRRMSVAYAASTATASERHALEDERWQLWEEDTSLRLARDQKLAPYDQLLSDPKYRDRDLGLAPSKSDDETASTVAESERVYSQRMDLLDVATAVRRLQKIRVVVEVAFPMILGLIAVVSSLRPQPTFGEHAEPQYVLDGPECEAARQRSRASSARSGLTPPRPVEVLAPKLAQPLLFAPDTAVIALRVDSTGRARPRTARVLGLRDTAYATALGRWAETVRFRPAVFDGCAVEGDWGTTMALP